MRTTDDVFGWAEGLMDAVEETRGGYRPFVSLEAREREREVAERIVVNDRLRQVVEECHKDEKARQAQMAEMSGFALQYEGPPPTVKWYERLRVVLEGGP